VLVYTALLEAAGVVWVLLPAPERLAAAMEALAVLEPLARQTQAEVVVVLAMTASRRVVQAALDLSVFGGLNKENNDELCTY
jgi:F420-dependent methylenetetrahydromethanopterin dehydrogenase